MKDFLFWTLLFLEGLLLDEKLIVFVQCARFTGQFGVEVYIRYM